MPPFPRVLVNDARELRDAAEVRHKPYLEVRGLEIYNLLPQGVAGSLLTKGFFEKKPKVSYTGRNWRTVEKLANL